MAEDSNFHYPVPTASPYVDIDQYVPLLLSAVEAEFLQRRAWLEEDEETAEGYIQDLLSWLSTEFGASIMASVPTASIQAFAGSSAPDGWLLCDGSLISRTTYADLFAAIGTTYGSGDGSTTFKLPDLRGRTPIGAGQGTNLTNRALAAVGGAETHQLSVGELAAHDHVVYYGSTAGTLQGSMGPANAYNPNVTGTTGSNTPHNNMQPFLAVNYLIKT